MSAMIVVAICASDILYWHRVLIDISKIGMCPLVFS